MIDKSESLRAVLSASRGAARHLARITDSTAVWSEAERQRAALLTIVDDLTDQLEDLAKLERDAREAARLLLSAMVTHGLQGHSEIFARLDLERRAEEIGVLYGLVVDVALEPTAEAGGPDKSAPPARYYDGIEL